METAVVAYKPSRAEESWEEVHPCSRLSNTYQDCGQNRCSFNTALQFMTGIPHIEYGLQRGFVVAGLETRQDIQKLWTDSLARLVLNSIGHIKRAAATDSVGDLRWFVEELGRFPAMQDVVQWRDRKRGILVQQDAEQVLQDLFKALADESSTVLNKAFPDLNLDEAVTYYKTAFSRVMRSSTSCTNGKVCGAGSEHDTGNITPVLKVGLGDAQFGRELVKFDQILKAFWESSAHSCNACRTLQTPVSSQLVTTNTLQLAPQVLILIFGREQPEIQGVSGRSEVAVMLQDEYVLRYGMDDSQKQHYLVRQYMFHDGVGSSGGHFTVAVREQQGGKYKQGDKWRYLDSVRPVEILSLDQMVYKYPMTVYAVLLVAKAQPQDDPRPMLVAPPAPRALPSVPWETEPRTPPGSPTQPPLAADYTSDEWGCDGWQQADPTGEAHRNAFQPAAIAPPPPRASSGHAQGNKGNDKKPYIGGSSSSSALTEQLRQHTAVRALAVKAAHLQQAQADRRMALVAATSATATGSTTGQPAQSASLSKAQRREDKKSHQRAVHTPNQSVVEYPTSGQEFSLPAYIANAGKTSDTLKTNTPASTPKPINNPKPVRSTPSPRTADSPMPVVESISSSQDMSWPAFIVNARKTTDSQPAVSTKPQSFTPKPIATSSPGRPSPSPFLKADPKPLAAKPSVTPMSSPSPPPTSKASTSTNAMAVPQSMPPPALAPQAGLTLTAAPILKAAPVPEKVPAAKLQAGATKKVKPAAPLVKPPSSPPPSLSSSSPSVSSSSNSSSFSLPPPSLKPSTTDLLPSPLTSSSLTTSSNASSPKPAARKAKPGSSQRKRGAKLSQQAAAAHQTAASSSAADLKPATEQAKPQKSAAVPAANQPQIVSPSQPASKAVQSNVAAAGVGVQPPLVELDSVQSTTAAEVVTTPDAGVKPVKKQAAIPTETPDASTGAPPPPPPLSASAGVVKLTATQRRKRQRQHQKQKAAAASAADLPPVSESTATLADSQTEATLSPDTPPIPDAAAGTSLLLFPPSATVYTTLPSPSGTSSLCPTTHSEASTTPPPLPSTSSPPPTTDSEASTSPPPNPREAESPLSTVRPPSSPVTSSPTDAPPPASNPLSPVPTSSTLTATPSPDASTPSLTPSTSSPTTATSSPTSASSATTSTSPSINPTSPPTTPTSIPPFTTPSTTSFTAPKSQMSVDTELLTGPAAVSPLAAVPHGRPDTPHPGLDPTQIDSAPPLSPSNHMTITTPSDTGGSSRERHAGSRRPNSGDHAGPGKKCLVMSVAIPLLAGACVLGAGLLIGPHIVGRMSSVKTSMLSWVRR